MSFNSDSYFSVGSVFKYKKVELKVVESEIDCVGCYFKNKINLCLDAPRCGIEDREDKKNVIFSL